MRTEARLARLRRIVAEHKKRQAAAHRIAKFLIATRRRLAQKKFGPMKQVRVICIFPNA